MIMYPKKDLYSLYKKNLTEEDFSIYIPDVTKRRTLEIMNIAINCSEDWETALDIGGGTGHYTTPLLYKFKNVTLVEPDIFNTQNELKQKYKGLTIINDFIENIEFEKKINFILLADLFEHIPDIRSFMKKLSSIQDDGGVIYILTPNPLFCGPAIKSGLHHSLMGSHGHIRHYFKNEVIKILSEFDYRLEFHSYEEFWLRFKLRTFLKGLSRRDKKYSKYIYYRYILGPIFRFFLKPLVLLIDLLIYALEYIFKNDPEKCMSSVYIFKKQ